MKNIFKSKKIILIISGILFLIVTTILLSGHITALDEKVQSYVIGLRNDNLTSIMITITNICSFYAIVALSLLLLFIIKNKKIPLAIITNAICIAIISELCKLIIRRDRPIGISLINETGFSYPSGHLMIGMAFYGFIAYLFYKKIKSKPLKALLVIFFLILFIIMGFSRIYLGVHYFSDVVAGFLGATAYLMIFIHYYKKLILKEDK